MMSPAPSPAPGKPYGLARGCRVGGIARSTVSWQRHEPARPAARRGPLGPCADDALVAHRRRLLAASPLPGEGDRQVWARRRHGGLRTSPRRGGRLRRAHQLRAPPRQGPPHGPTAQAGPLIPAQVETLWGTARTATDTRQEGQGAIFLAVDHDAAECRGIHAAQQGTRFAALAPLRQGVRTACGAFGPDSAHGLVLRHDRGSQERSQVFQEEVRVLGLTSAPALVRAPAGNGCAARCIRTLKEPLLWLKTFETVAALRLALPEFQRQYNETWLIGRHGYKAPAQVRQEQCWAWADAASF